jgi:hypothetical protein
VKRPGSFGRFGTGLKFAIATILRGGGTITINRGLDVHTLATVARDVRGEQFQIVTLDKISMGITTTLGRDWEPWMVLRELGCNAIDEGGAFGTTQAKEPVGYFSPDPVEGQTTITVIWDELETAFLQRKELFLEGVPVWENDHVRILPGASAHVFYRGVRVLKLDKPSLFTYDILAEQQLTEDRTLAGMWLVDGIIRDAFITMKNQTLVSQVLTVQRGNYHEARLDFENASWGLKPSKEFLDAAVEARESRKLNNESARKVLLRHIRDSAEEVSTYGSYKRYINDAFAYAQEQLAAVGIKFTDEQKFITVDELPGADTFSMVENGRIYVLTELTKQPARKIAMELLARWVDLNVECCGMEDAIRLLSPIIINACPALKMDEALIKEDAVTEEVAAA